MVPHLRAAKTQRFKQVITGTNRIGPKRSEQHGVGWWARRHKCQCEPCITAKRQWDADRRAENKAKVAAGRIDYVPKWRHGTTYAWDHMKCDCLECLDHKVKYIREKNRKVTERRRAAREAERAKAG